MITEPRIYYFAKCHSCCRERLGWNHISCCGRPMRILERYTNCTACSAARKIDLDGDFLKCGCCRRDYDRDGNLLPVDADEITAVVRVVDTREYRQNAAGQWRPVKGSGENARCARCGEGHEVHVTVETRNGQWVVIGDRCGKGTAVESEVELKAANMRGLKRDWAKLEHARERRSWLCQVDRETGRLAAPEPERADGWVRVGDAVVARDGRRIDEDLVRVARGHWRAARRRKLWTRRAWLGETIPVRRDLDVEIDALTARVHKAEADAGQPIYAGDVRPRF